MLQHLWLCVPKGFSNWECNCSLFISNKQEITDLPASAGKQTRWRMPTKPESRLHFWELQGAWNSVLVWAKRERERLLHVQKCHFKGTADIADFLAMPLLSNCPLKCQKPRVKLKEEKQRWWLQSGRYQCFSHPFKSPTRRAICETPVIWRASWTNQQPPLTPKLDSQPMEETNPPSHRAAKHLQGESMAAIVVSLVWCQLGLWKPDFSDGRAWAAPIQAKPAENQPRSVGVRGLAAACFRRSCSGFVPLLWGLLSYRRTGNPLLCSLDALPRDLFCTGNCLVPICQGNT